MLVQHLWPNLSTLIASCCGAMPAHCSRHCGHGACPLHGCQLVASTGLSLAVACFGSAAAGARHHEQPVVPVAWPRLMGQRRWALPRRAGASWCSCGRRCPPAWHGAPGRAGAQAAVGGRLCHRGCALIAAVAVHCLRIRRPRASWRPGRSADIKPIVGAAGCISRARSLVGQLAANRARLRPRACRLTGARRPGAWFA